MDGKTIFAWALDHWSFCAFVLAFFIQITPIFKANPLTALLRWFSKCMTTDLRRDIGEMRGMIEAQQGSIDENEKDRIRWEVLDFANACRNKVKHTREQFAHIIALNDKYQQLLRKTGDKNGVYETDYAYILSVYEDVSKRNDFL